MRQSRFTEAQIIGMIKEQEAGMPTAEVCRRHGLSPASFYKFKAKYGGMNVSDTHRLRSLEDENAKLKRLLADTMLDNVVLKDLLGKRWCPRAWCNLFSGWVLSRSTGRRFLPDP